MTKQGNPEQMINDLMNKTIATQDGVIVQIMKEVGLDAINMKDIVRQVSANGTETWKYKNKAFVRLFPFEFQQVTDGKVTKIIVTQRIEKMKFVIEEA